MSKFDEAVNEILEFTIPFTKKWYKEKRKGKKTDGWELFYPFNLSDADKKIGKGMEYSFIYDNGDDLRIDIKIPLNKSNNAIVVINDKKYKVKLNYNDGFEAMMSKISPIIKDKTGISIDIKKFNNMILSYQAAKDKFADELGKLNRHIDMVLPK